MRKRLAFYEGFGGYLNSSRISAQWIRGKLRIAISLKEFEKFKRDIKPGYLAFNSIFGDKKRLVFPAKDLRDDFDSSLAQNIRKNLINLDLMGDSDKIDWDKGLIIDENGRKVKLGKKIDKGISKFEKKYPEVWRNSKKAILAKRKALQAEDQFRTYVVGPLLNLENKLSKKAGISWFGFVSLYTTLKQIFPDNLNSEQMQHTLLELSKPAQTISHFRTPQERQEIWIKGLEEILLAPENTIDLLKEKLDEAKKSMEEITKQSKEFAEKTLENLSSEERSKINFEVDQRNRERDKLRSTILFLNGTYKTYKDWPLEERAELAKSIRRAMENLIKTRSHWTKAAEDLIESRRGITSDEDGREQIYLQNLEYGRQEYDLWKSQGDTEKSIIISRSPVDVLRMSDHPTAPQNIRSCHSEGGDYFHCAIDESHGGGLIAYVVDNKDLEGLDLEQDEIFKDRDRKVEGITPYSRLRLRRFEHKTTDEELAIPENRIYGVQYGNFSDQVMEWAREAQKEMFQKKPRLDDYILTGGDYRDSTDAVLFNNFFDTPGRDRGNTEHQKKPSKKEVPIEETDDFWKWMERTYKEVPNPNPDGHQRYITPSTLRGYSSNNQSPYQQAARDIVQRYRTGYLYDRHMKEYGD